MPYPGSKSLVVSLACHSAVDEGDISTERIQWGFVRESGSGEEAGHCSFSKEVVRRVREGSFYTGIVGSEA